MSNKRPLSAVAGLILALLAMGCDFDGPVRIGPFATLVVTTATTGSNLDSNGYQLVVTGPSLNVNRSIAANGSTSFSVGTFGDCTVELRDVAANCAIDLNPQIVGIAEWRTETVTFNVSCE